MKLVTNWRLRLLSNMQAVLSFRSVGGETTEFALPMKTVREMGKDIKAMLSSPAVSGQKEIEWKPSRYQIPEGPNGSVEVAVSDDGMALGLLIRTPDGLELAMTLPPEDAQQIVRDMSQAIGVIAHGGNAPRQ